MTQANYKYNHCYIWSITSTITVIFGQLQVQSLLYLVNYKYNHCYIWSITSTITVIFGQLQVQSLLYLVNYKYNHVIFGQLQVWFQLHFDVFKLSLLKSIITQAVSQDVAASPASALQADDTGHAKMCSALTKGSTGIWLVYFSKFY